MLNRAEPEEKAETQTVGLCYPRADRTAGSEQSCNETKLKVGLAGCGYWGRRLLRNLNSAHGYEILRISDPDWEARAFAREECPSAEIESCFETLIQDRDIDAIVIATPPATHFDLTRRALSAGKHVLVEKPITVILSEAEHLVRVAKENSLTLFVDHTFRYSPAVEELRRLVATRVVGEPLHIDAVRCAFGRFSNEINVIWDIAIHDLSILAHILGHQPVSISARGGLKSISGTDAVAHMDLKYETGLNAHIHISWLSPHKIRRLTLTGEKGTIVYEDGDRGPTISTHLFTPHTPPRLLPASFSTISQVEPLGLVVAAFRKVILERRLSNHDDDEILPLMRVLDAAARSLDNDGVVQHVSL